MDFLTGLPLSAGWMGDKYNSILVIIDQLTKMVHYKLVKITIDTPGLAKVILDVVVWYHNLPDSIVINKVFFLPRNSGYRSVTSSALNRGSQPYSNLRWMVKPRGKIAS